MPTVSQVNPSHAPGVPLADRLRWVARFRHLVAAHEPRLAALAEEEIAKPRVELLTADIAPLLAACRFVEKNAGWILSSRRLSRGLFGGPWWLGRVRLWEQREPLGHVAIIATWNYPVGLLGVQLLHALAAGNAVTVKPSERCPKTQSLLLDLAEEAAGPSMSGLIHRAQATRETGRQLLATGVFDHVVFTGSTDVGRSIAQTLAPRFIPATLELSGRDSAIVLDDADPALAADAIWSAVCMNAGQTCMGPRRALVHEAVYPAFVAALAALATKTQARSLIDPAAAALCHELVLAAVVAGGRDAAGRRASLAFTPADPLVPTPRPTDAPPSSPDQGVIAPPTGSVWTPTAVVDCPRIAALVEGKHFGPALAVVKVSSLADALDLHRAIDQRLATSLFTKDLDRAKAIAPTLGSTTVTINDVIVSTAHPAAGIGGQGPSGLGVSRGIEGLLNMTRPVYVSHSNGLIRRAGRTYSRTAVAWLARMIRWTYAPPWSRPPAGSAFHPTPSAPEAHSPPAPASSKSPIPTAPPAPSLLSDASKGDHGAIPLVDEPSSGSRSLNRPSDPWVGSPGSSNDPLADTVRTSPSSPSKPTP